MQLLSIPLFALRSKRKYSPEEYVYEFGTVLTVGEKQTIAPIKQWKDEAKTEYTMVIYEIPESSYAHGNFGKGLCNGVRASGYK